MIQSQVQTNLTQSITDRLVVQPIVSIVIPTYNREHLLPIAVDSVRAQTFGDWELLIVDDHSTDGTRELVEQWSAEDGRIRYLVNERTKGPAGARNTGIDHSRREYVAFLDSDDEWMPYHLEKMVATLNSLANEIDLMTANAVRRFRSTGKVYQQTMANAEGAAIRQEGQVWLFDPEKSFDLILHGEGLITTQTIVMRRNWLQRIRFREELPPGPEDFFFQLELTNSGIKIGHFADVHLTYWAHGDNLTTAGGISNPAKIASLFQTYQVQYKLMLRSLQLTRRQRRQVINLLCEEAFWQIGYNGYLQLGHHKEARRWFRTALKCKPWRLDYWKTYLTSYLRRHPVRQPFAN